MANAPTFVNVQLFKMIIITCNQSTDKLVNSAVTLNGQDPATTQTITGVPAHLAAKGVTQADLCSILSGNYDDLPKNTYNPSVELPDLTP